MFIKKGNNIFTTTLEILRVKFTKTYSDAFFNTHPHKYNLFGISKILKEYGVDNGGVQILYGNSIKRQGTPTILVNGYLLPDSYEIKDLKYFSTLDI